LKRFVKRKEIRNKGKKALETSEKFLEIFQDYWIGILVKMFDMHLMPLKSNIKESERYVYL